MYAYIGGIISNHEGVLLAVGGMEDHIHLYVSLPSTMSLSKCVEIIKANSSRWIKEHHQCPEFAWQYGYGAFSVSPSADEDVREYILNQEEHHRVRSFQEEYLAFLKRHDVSYNPRYVFEDAKTVK